jgi:hypothetical protein
VASGAAFLLALPLAIVAQMLSEGAADFVIHVAVGIGSLLLAAAVFDFRLPRWLNWVGAVSAALFGTIFLLQAASQLIPSEALHYLAFDVLGQELEGVLPYVGVVWFVGLLIADSRGWTRVLGVAVMAIVVGASIVNIVGPWLGLDASAPLVVFILPFGWLLLESAKARPTGSPTGQPRIHELAEAPVA